MEINDKGKVKVVAVCGFPNAALVFLDIHQIMAGVWDSTIICTFDNKKIKEEILSRGVAFGRLSGRQGSQGLGWGWKIKAMLLDVGRGVMYLLGKTPQVTGTDIIFLFDGDPVSYGRWLVRATVRNGAKSFRYLWGTVGNLEVNKKHVFLKKYRCFNTLLGFRGKGDFVLQSVCEKVLVKSKEHAIRANNRGVSKEDIFVVGDYRLNKLKRLQNKSPITQSAHGIKVLILTQPVRDLGYFASFRAVILRLLEQRGLSVFVKVHPREEINTYREIMSDLGSKVTIYEHGGVDTDYLISGCDVVIGCHSTTLITSFFLKKRVLLYEFNSAGFHHYQPMLKTLAAFRRGDEKKLAKCAADSDYTCVPYSDLFKAELGVEFDFKEQMERVIRESSR